MTVPNDHEYFFAFEVSAARMDALWAGGWRHFGWYFFRYRTAWHGEKRFTVVPLRTVLERFAPSRGQKRVLARNRDVEVVIRPAFVDREKERLFRRHVVRFSENAPRSLYDYLSPAPATSPCANHEVALYLDGRLVGATFLDVGERATSAVYAMFEPEESRRSLGIFMMLESIRYSSELGCRHYYQGYAYREPFVYDYKKNFAGLEELDWERGWSPATGPA